MDDVPAHYIFVMLVQATLFPWMLAAVFWFWQGRAIPVADLLKPAVGNGGAPGSALSALSASVPPTTVPHMLWIASGLTLSLVVAVVAYIAVRWPLTRSRTVRLCLRSAPISLSLSLSLPPASPRTPLPYPDHTPTICSACSRHLFPLSVSRLLRSPSFPQPAFQWEGV